MAWTTPKTDWNATDYYNYGDLNRVEANTQHINDLLESIGYTPAITGIDTSRDNTDITFYDDLNRIETNINNLSTSSYEPLTWENPVTDWQSLDNFDYNDANRLEGNLLGLYTMVNNIIAEFEKCGALTCGQSFRL